MWARLEIGTSGDLGSTLNGAGFTPDPDFAVWGPLSAWDVPLGTPSRCSWAANAGRPGGLSFDGVGPSEGAAGDGFVSLLPVLAGERYLLYVNSFMTSSPVGFTFTTDLFNGGTLVCPEPPVAAFMGSPLTILTGQSVDLTDLSTNAPIAWSWTFPGASPETSTLAAPTGIVFNESGCSDVSLIARNAAGSDVEVRTCEVNVVGTGVAEIDKGVVRIEQRADALLVDAPGGGLLDVRLLDALGRPVRVLRATAPVVLSTNELATGRYSLLVRRTMRGRRIRW